MKLRRPYLYRGEGIPRWVMITHGLAGAVTALAWLLTVRIQLQAMVDAAHWMQR